MDDRELEGRLRDRLHSRFDAARPSPELGATLAQAFATRPQPLGWRSLRAPQLRLAWSLAGAAAVIAAVAITLGTNLNIGHPPASSPPVSSTPVSSAPRERSFVVLPPAGQAPSKPATTLASDVLSARLRALGFGNFSSGGGFAIVVKVPADGPTDAATRRVLAATGSVEFVPLPSTDYGDGLLAAEVGKPLPKDEPALFGWEGIDSVGWAAGQQDHRTLDFKLKPAAATALGAFTAAHVNESFAIVVDGTVALVPVVQAEIPAGDVTISSPDSDAASFEELGAILIGGMLPEGWRGADVPAIVDEQAAVATALSFYPTAEIESADVTTREDEQGRRAVWWVILGGNLPPSCPMLHSGATVCPSTGSGIVVVIDAVTGDVVSIDSNG